MQQQNELTVAQNNDINNESILKGHIEKQRIRAFDLARGIAIVAMVTIHSIVFIGSPNLTSTIGGYCCNVIISVLAAPLFMFVMGILLTISKKDSFEKNILRGLIILTIGYVLNFLRGTIPVGAALSFGWLSYSDDIEAPFSYMLEDDILQFAGIAFIFLALLRRTISSKYVWIAAGCIFAFVSPLLWDKEVDQPALNYILSLFTGSQEYNYFPFFPWIIFPIFGMAYGEFFKKCQNKKLFFNYSIAIGSLITILGITYIWLFSKDFTGPWLNGSFRQGQLPPETILIFTGFECIWISVCFYLTSITQENFIFKKLFSWSKNVTSFYVIQWILIGWLCVMLPSLEWPAIIACIIAVLLFTDAFLFTYQNIKKSYSNKILK